MDLASGAPARKRRSLFVRAKVEPRGSSDSRPGVGPRLADSLDLGDIGNMRDYPGARGTPGAGSGTRAQRVFNQITFERLAIALLHDQPVDVAIKKLDQALRGVAELARRFDQRAPHSIQ